MRIVKISVSSNKPGYDCFCESCNETKFFFSDGEVESWLKDHVGHR